MVLSMHVCLVPMTMSLSPSPLFPPPAETLHFRYGICGRPLRGLLPFVREAVGVPISAKGRSTRAVTPTPPKMPPSRLLKPAGFIPSSLNPKPSEAAPACDGGVQGGVGRPGPEAGLLQAEAERGGQTLLASLALALGSDFDVKEQVPVSLGL